MGITIKKHHFNYIIHFNCFTVYTVYTLKDNLGGNYTEIFILYIYNKIRSSKELSALNKK